MKEYVADTHALFWYLTARTKLGANARSAIQEAERGEALLYVLSIVLAELYYLARKLGLQSQFAGFYHQVTTAGYMQVEPFRAEEVLLFDTMTSISEMHDRIIAGFAHARRIPCLTRDPAIVSRGLVQTIW